VLPSEPGGYSGFNALFGAVNVNPLLTGGQDQPLPANYAPSGVVAPPPGDWVAPPVCDVFAPNATDSGPHAAPVNNLDAGTPGEEPPQSYQPGVTPRSQILDEDGQAGFPGFDGMEANNALGYTAAAQEAGIPVTYTYLSDVHDDQYEGGNDLAYGPGEVGYEAQIREYNAAFAAFFRRLARDHINKHNTLFLITVDEGDHFDGGPPLNPGCDGVNVPCQYTSSSGQRNVGEVDTNLTSLAQTVDPTAPSFGFDYDDAPASSSRAKRARPTRTTRRCAPSNGT
jgi:hypothetical protein